MNKLKNIALFSCLLLVPLITQGQEPPNFWTVQDGLVRHLSLDGGLGAPIADVEIFSGIEMKVHDRASFPATWYPIPSFPGGAAFFQQLNLNTQELETITRGGPNSLYDPDFDSQGHLWTIGREDLVNFNSIVEWDLSDLTYTIIPTDISPRYPVGLASYGGFLYGVTAVGYPPSHAPYHFVEIDWDSAAVTELNDNLLPDSSHFVAMDFDDHGILWIAYELNGNLEMGRITNLNTLNIESMGSFPATKPFSGMAVAPRGDVIAIPTLSLRGLLGLGLLICGLGIAMLKKEL